MDNTQSAPTGLSRRRRLKRAGVRLIAHLAPFFYIAYMALVELTSRVRRDGLEPIMAETAAGHDIALAILHQDLFVTPYFLRKLTVQSVASVGDAGNILAATMERRGLVMQRGGSSSRESRRTPVLRKMVDYALAHRGTGLLTGFTVDGSTGPAGACKAGVAQFAAMTGVPIYCLRAHASRGLHLNTWDRTLIPLPFSQLSFEVAGPFQAAGDDAESARRSVEAALHDLHRRSFVRHGQQPVPELVCLDEGEPADSPDVPVT